MARLAGASLCILLLGLVAVAQAERSLKDFYISFGNPDEGGSLLRVASDSGAEEAAAAFRESPLTDEVAAESAAAALRADDAAAAQGLALLGRLLAPLQPAPLGLDWTAAAPRGGAPEPATEGEEEEKGQGAAEYEEADYGTEVDGGAPALLLMDDRGVRRLAPASMSAPGPGFGFGAAVMDMFMRETASMLDALEAQHQRAAGAFLQQQAAAAAAAGLGPAPRRPCPHHAAAAAAARRMGPGEAVTIEMFSDGPRTVAFVNGQQVDPAELLATGGAAAGAASYGDDSYDDYAAESELFESPDGLGLDRALVVVMSFVCAATFVAFVRSLVQLRAAMRGAGGEPASPLYLTLPSAEDEAGCKVEAYNPARASYRAPRRSSGAGGLEHPLLPGGGADVSGARVMVVVPGVVCARDEAAAAAGVQSYGNEAFYQPLPDAERKA